MMVPPLGGVFSGAGMTYGTTGETLELCERGAGEGEREEDGSSLHGDDRGLLEDANGISGDTDE